MTDLDRERRVQVIIGGKTLLDTDYDRNDIVFIFRDGRITLAAGPDVADMWLSRWRS